MPLLEENSEANWLLDSVAKKNNIQRVLTSMSGSVVTSGDGKVTRAKAKSAPKAKGKPKAKASAKATAAPNLQLPDEAKVTESTVLCSTGVRQKLWIDDLLACANHTCASLETMGVEAADLKHLKKHLIRTGLLFALKGTAVLETAKSTKTHKKWSTLRPALKEHAILYLIQAPFYIFRVANNLNIHSLVDQCTAPCKPKAI